MIFLFSLFLFFFFCRRTGHVNYEDPYVSVGLPIFSIHGNHDDPTREGGIEALAALDLLHVASLVNYFGKSNKVGRAERYIPWKCEGGGGMPSTRL